MRLSVALLIGLALPAAALVLATPASAHAVYVSSNPPAYGILPSAPGQVVITLSEPVQPGTQTIRVTTSAGARVDVGTAQISGGDPRVISIGLGPAGPDVYTVAWVVEDAVDGHWTSGSFYFMIQNADGSLPGSFPGESPPSAPVSATEVLLRSAAFLSLAIALGGTAFAMIAWIPVGRDLEVVGGLRYESGFRVLLLWSRFGSLLYASAMGAWWVHAVTEAPPQIVPAIIGSSFSVSLVLRGLFGLAMAGSLSLAIAKAGRATPGGEADNPLRDPMGSEAALLPLVAAAALGLLALVAGSAGSHAAATSIPLLGTGLDALHETGVYAWVGGLMALVRLRPVLREPDARPLVRQVYGRFSALAGYAVALVLGAGVVLGILLVGSIDALLGTVYGWVLLVKVSLFVPLVTIGAINRYRVLPLASEVERLPGSIASLTRNVRIEALIGALVLVVAAVLTASVPPASAPSTATFDLKSSVDGVVVEFIVTPYPSTPGTYTFQILLWNATTGLGFDQTSGANLTFTLQTTTVAVAMEGPHGNHYFVDSPAISRPGTWRVDAAIARTAAPTLRATFYVVVSPGG